MGINYCCSLTATLKGPVSSPIPGEIVVRYLRKLCQICHTVPADMLHESNYSAFDAKKGKRLSRSLLYCLQSAPAASFVAGTSLSHGVHHNILCIVCLSIWKSTF